MTAPSPARPPHPLTAPERDLIRMGETWFRPSELHPRFSRLPSIAGGLFLRNREAIRPEGRKLGRSKCFAREGACEGHSGPQAGQPKLHGRNTVSPDPIVRGMIERGLLEVRADPNGPWARAYFTPAGVAALRELARDKRSLHPARYAHVRRELGLDVEAGEAGPDGDADATAVTE